MDPLTALSLAVNIIQLLEVAAKVVSGAQELVRSKDGYLAEHREADEVASDVELLTKALVSSERSWLDTAASSDLDQNEQALRDIADGCNEVAKELIRRLRKLKPHGNFRGLAVIRANLGKTTTYSRCVFEPANIDSHCLATRRDRRLQAATFLLS